MEIKKEAYVELDENMKIAADIGKSDVVFYDVRKSPFAIHGLYKPETEPYFHRLPTELAKEISVGIEGLERESSGGCVRFSTDSPYVAVKADYTAVPNSSHSALLATAGFDLYCDSDIDSRYVGSFVPPFSLAKNDEKQMAAVVNVRGKRMMRHFTVNFPNHSRIVNLYIGVSADAEIGGELPYKDPTPIVIYGSSIVHGSAASTPGHTYTNMLRRRLMRDVHNYGFSGNAKSEDAIIDYLATLPMSVFVYDYDHNANNVDYLNETHLRSYKRFREKRPDVPFIMISSPNVVTNRNWPTPVASARRSVIMDTYRYAIENGDKHVYYIDGETFFLGRDENDCTVDTIHPSDLGFAKMANVIACTVKTALSER